MGESPWFQMVTSAPPRVLFTGGGTGGHLFPGIAVAREFVRRHPLAHVAFAGTRRGLEQRMVPREGFALDLIRVSGLVGKSWATKLRSLVLLPVALLDAWHILRRQRPDLVIGLGGYSAGPLVLLAAATGRPTLLLEQNTLPGVTNRLLAWVAHATAVSHDVTLPYFGKRGFISGNPVRSGFFEAQPPADSPATVHVLVLGGSQGAHAINVAMVEAAKIVASASRSIRVTHQTGRYDLEMVREGYRAASLTARVEEFVDAVDEVMATADLVVCRAGATTLAETAATGRPVIVVPYPHATNDHQRHNACVVKKAGAGEIIDQSDLDGTVLGRRVVALANDDARRHAMAVASRGLAKPVASLIVVDRIEQLLGLRDETRR